jgi:hypothetical protein
VAHVLHALLDEGGRLHLICALASRDDVPRHVAQQVGDGEQQRADDGVVVGHLPVDLDRLATLELGKELLVQVAGGALEASGTELSKRRGVLESDFGHDLI